VTTTVLAFVITDGGPLVVGLAVVVAVETDEADEDGLEVVAELALELGLPVPGAFPTELSVPVKYTDQVFDPPPTVKSAKRSLERQCHLKLTHVLVKTLAFCVTLRI